MKLVTWNINGIRSFDWKETLKSLDADIVCIQETKVTRDNLEEPIALIDGYTSYFAFSRKRTGYSGVATFCKKDFTPVKSEEGLGGTLPSSEEKDAIGHYEEVNAEFVSEDLKALDQEGRCVLTQHQFLDQGVLKSFVLINVYCPRADPEKEERKLFKLNFYKLLQLRAHALTEAGHHVIIVGDINTSHKQIDHCDPYQEFFGQDPCRKWMDNFIVNCRQQQQDDEEWKICHVANVAKNMYVDAFRHFYPQKTSAFTCWNTKMNCRENNFGTRIDYILVHKSLAATWLAKCDIQPDTLGSDHCPVVAVFCHNNYKTVPATKPPAFCTKYYSEFSGTQQKLFSYFERGEKRKKTHDDLNMKSAKSGKKCQANIKSFFVKKEVVKIEHVEKREVLKVEEVEKRESNASAWKMLMKGPPVAPCCKGHKESAVLRTVKKKGPNCGRQFWCCAKGEGKAGDPNARCDFFKWLK